MSQAFYRPSPVTSCVWRHEARAGRLCAGACFESARGRGGGWGGSSVCWAAQHNAEIGAARTVAVVDDGRPYMSIHRRGVSFFHPPSRLVFVCVCVLCCLCVCLCCLFFRLRCCSTAKAAAATAADYFWKEKRERKSVPEDAILRVFTTAVVWYGVRWYGVPKVSYYYYCNCRRDKPFFFFLQLEVISIPVHREKKHEARFALLSR